MSFGEMEIQQRLRKDSVLRKVAQLIHWQALRPQLKGLYKREQSQAGGQEPFDALVMFKALLLGQWHSLSDPKLEEALQVRLDFIEFCGLRLSEAVPDETTLCRFRNRLVQAGKLEGLLRSVNAQLQAQGLMVQSTSAAVLDATLVQSAARPRQDIVVQTTEQGQEVRMEDGSQPGVQIQERSSADPQASWVKKGKKSHYGYRSYVSVDAQDGYIQGVHTAPANQSEVTQLVQAVENLANKPERLYADKGYASAANRAYLRSQGIKSGIMHKGQRASELKARQKLANRLISHKRFIVEQCFGTAKRLFGMARASYLGVAKVNAQFTLKAMCMNLLKAANKICGFSNAGGLVRLQVA